MPKTAASVCVPGAIPGSTVQGQRNYATTGGFPGPVLSTRLDVSSGCEPETVENGRMEVAKVHVEEEYDEEPEEEEEAHHLQHQDHSVRQYKGGLFGRTPEEERALILSLTGEQRERYDSAMKSSLHKPSIKALVRTVLNGPVKEQVEIIVRSSAKMFVGELVEEARAVAAEYGEPKGEPLRPDHITEAFRRQVQSGLVPNAIHPKRRFGY